MNFGILVQLRNGHQTIVLTDTQEHANDLAEIHRSGRVPEQMTGRIAKLADGRWYVTPNGKGSQWFSSLELAGDFVNAL